MFRRVSILLLCLVMIAGVTACSQPENGSPDSSQPEVQEAPPPPPEFPVFVDGTRVSSRPGRVVSLSPALTEKIFDLGLDSRLAGVSDHCDYPAAAGSLESCGIALLPDISAILSLRPHMVISEVPLPEEDRAELLRQGIDVVVIERANSIDELWEVYIAIARIFEGEHAGRHMGNIFADIVGGWLDDLAWAVEMEILESLADEEIGDDSDEYLGMIPAIYLRMLPFNVATGDTLENELMRIIGLRNIAREQYGWLYPEELATADGPGGFRSAQFIFFDENYLAAEDLSENTFYITLPAVTGGRAIPIDGYIMERQSLRTFGQLLEMARYIWPEADFPHWPPRIVFSL